MYLLLLLCTRSFLPCLFIFPIGCILIYLNLGYPKSLNFLLLYLYLIIICDLRETSGSSQGSCGIQAPLPCGAHPWHCWVRSRSLAGKDRGSFAIPIYLSMYLHLSLKVSLPVCLCVSTCLSMCLYLSLYVVSPSVSLLTFLPFFVGFHFSSIFIQRSC